jgi:hypothetical protein
MNPGRRCLSTPATTAAAATGTIEPWRDDIIQG